jgi:capsular polysaccharide biosynthesis protein/MinD-like ATPase involved in chromosome partitioning or flagellar assembly
MSEATTPGEALRPYSAALRRWWPLAAAIVVIAGLMGVAVAARLPKSYTATAKVLLGQQRQVDSLLGTADYSPDPERELNTSLQLITLEPIADEVSRSLGLREPGSALVGQVATAVDRNSNIVAISVRDHDPARAAVIANAFAAAYRDYRARSDRVALQDAIAAAQRQLMELSSERARRALRRELTRLEVAEPLQTGGVQVVHEATAASATRSPRPMLSGLLGAFLGLVVAGLTIVVLGRTDRRVFGDGDLEDLTGRPVIARVPRAPRAAGDAFVSLALSLTHDRAGGSPAGILLVTSAGPGEGTPEVALGLTRAFGVIGRRAIAMEADLRDPTFAERLGAAPTGGLAAVLAGTAGLDGELAAVGPRAAAVPAGFTSEVPQALLAGDRMEATVEEACGRADVVVIAGAPAGVVGDSLAVADLVDKVLLVARDDVTRPDELRRALRALTDAGVPPAGVVATVRPRRRPLDVLRSARRQRRPLTQSGAATAARSEVTVG